MQSINPFQNFGSGGGAPQNPFAAAPTGAWGAPASAYTLDTSYEPHGEGGYGGQPAMPSASSGTFLLSVPSDATVPAVVPFTASTAAPVAMGTLGAPPSSSAAPPAAGGWAAAASKWGKPSSGAGGRDDGSFGASSLPPGITSDTRPLLAVEGGGGGSGTAAGAGGSGAAPGDQPKEDYSKYAFYNIRKYRPYFDVDTKEVLWRVLSSFIGAFKNDFMEVTQTNPDLYGPFWVATTLIFVTAASGNLSSYIAYEQAQSKSPPLSPPSVPPGSTALSPPPPSSSPTVKDQWFADTTKLGTSAGIFYGYIFIISLILWGWVKYLKGSVKIVNMFCVYGYALTIFIPISVICVIPIDIMRWVLVMTATLISGGFIVMNLKRTTSDVALVKSIWLLGTVAAAHVGLGIALKLYFFSY